MKCYERFLKYVLMDTTSDQNSTTIPSTNTQLLLANVLIDELKQLNLADIYLSQYGYVYATLKSNIDYEVDTFGLIAHMDTSCDFSGENIKVDIIKNYDGKDITLKNGLVTKISDFADMKRFVGHDLIVTDGNTLLGADDKAGIAEIITLMHYYQDNPNVKHGDIKIAFTPDEEIGCGADHFDVARFDAKYAYTLDGGPVNEVCYETFNAATCNVEIKGNSIHPGSAKDVMINAINIGHEFHQMLPSNMRPEHTDNYDGFNHLMQFDGNVTLTKLEYIIRNHDEVKFNQQIELMDQIKDFINNKYKQELVSVKTILSYANMYKELKNHMDIINNVYDCMLELNMKPMSNPIRGGTDGARLTFMNLPCPNLGTGGANCHGPNEVCSIQEMDIMVELMKKIVEKVIKK